MKLSLFCAVLYFLCAALYLAAWINGQGTHNLLLGCAWAIGGGFQCAAAYYQRKADQIRGRR